MNKSLLQEAKPLASYSSHSGLTSKMWILPDGRIVSFGCQHYEWTTAQASRLKEHYGIYVGRIRPPDDTAIRLMMLRRGAVRVNYEHCGGKLTLGATYRLWGIVQATGMRAIVAANAREISFVCVRLLNSRGRTMQEQIVVLVEIADRLKVRRILGFGKKSN